MQEKELQFTQQLYQRSSSTGIDEDKASSADGISHATNRTRLERLEKFLGFKTHWIRP